MKREQEIQNNIRDFYGIIRVELTRIRSSVHEKYRMSYVQRMRKAIAWQRKELQEILEVKSILSRLEADASMMLDDIKLGKGPGDEQPYETLLAVIPRLKKIIDRE